MHPRRRSVTDEVHGLRAIGSLATGDVDETLAELNRPSANYLLGFLLRLALVVPRVAIRVGWTLARRRLTGSRR